MKKLILEPIQKYPNVRYLEISYTKLYSNLIFSQWLMATTARIRGYSKFWFTKIYYNLIIGMLFDVAVSFSNFNKLTKKKIVKNGLRRHQRT